MIFAMLVFLDHVKAKIFETMRALERWSQSVFVQLQGRH